MLCKVLYRISVVLHLLPTSYSCRQTMLTTSLRRTINGELFISHLFIDSPPPPAANDIPIHVYSQSSHHSAVFSRDDRATEGMHHSQLVKLPTASGRETREFNYLTQPTFISEHRSSWNRTAERTNDRHDKRLGRSYALSEGKAQAEIDRPPRFIHSFRFRWSLAPFESFKLTK